MPLRFVGLAIVALVLAACGGGEPGGLEEETLSGEVRGTDRPADTGTAPTCADARLATRTCTARVEAACEPMERRLRQCLVTNATDGTAASQDAARVACAAIARQVHTCRSACDPGHDRMTRICNGACLDARATAVACADGYTDCEAGANRYRNCLQHTRTTCAADRDATRPTDRTDLRMCSDPVAYCTHQAGQISDCFATCRVLRTEAREACGPTRERGDEPTRERGDEPTRERGDEPTRERGDEPTRDGADDPANGR